MLLCWLVLYAHSGCSQSCHFCSCPTGLLVQHAHLQLLVISCRDFGWLTTSCPV